MKIKKEYAYIGGGALLFWLLSRRKGTVADCPIPKNLPKKFPVKDKD
jgi:hypothetical protein